MAKLIKKYQNTPGPMPKPNFNNDEFWSDYKYRWDIYDENKFKKYADDFDFTGVNKYILVDENGRPIPKWKADKIENEQMQRWEQQQQAYEDAKNAQIDENGDVHKTLDDITVIPDQNKDLLSPIDEYLQAPTFIPKTVDQDETFREQEKWHQEQSQEHREALDRQIHETNKYVDWLGLSPFILTGAGIAGATALPWLGGKLAAWALANPAAANALFYGNLGGETFNLGTKAFGYEDAGHWAYHQTGHNFADYDKLPEWQKTLWNFMNLGYFVPGGSSLIDRATTLSEQAAGRMLRQPYNILNQAQKLGTVPAASVYKGYEFMNTANQLYKYGPQATKSLIKDIGFYTTPRSKLYTTYEASDPNILKSIRPSDREQLHKLTDIYKTLEEYKNKPLSYSYEGTARGYGLSNQRLDATTTYTSYPDGSNHGEVFTIKYKNPEEVRRQIQSQVDFSKRYPELAGHHTSSFYEQLSQLDFEQPVNEVFNYYHNRRIPFTVNTEAKPLTQEAQKMTELLGDYGHVTGSSITATSSFAQHTPADVDVVTTQRNLPEVLRRLGVTQDVNTIKLQNGHTKVWSPEFNAYVDVQVLESGPSGKATGKISYETYSKLFPKEFESMRNMETPIGELPISPEELLKLHKDNVYNISLQDQFLTGKPKHVERDFAILGANNPEEVQTAYNAMINSYRTPIGDKFQTFEDQNIHIDYSDIENNLEFLKRLGYDEQDAKIVAQDPLKMKFITEEYAYRRTTSNRAVEEAKLYGDSPTRILDAINTNFSYSNIAGNQARYAFGGADNALSYGGNKGWVTSFQYPIRNPEKIHKPLDVFNEIGKFVVAPPESHPNIVEQQRKYFRFSEDVAKKIQEILDLNFTPESLNDVTRYLVPHNNPHLTESTGGDKAKLLERVGNINDQLGKLLDIDHIYSMQPGFNDDFIGRLLKDIPGLRSSTTLISPGQQYGYELPHIFPPDILEHHTYNLHKNYFDSKNPAHRAAKRRYTNALRKQFNAQTEQGIKEKEIMGLVNNSYDARVRFRGNLAKTLATVGILGGGIGIGYGLNNITSPMSQYLQRGNLYLERQGYTPKQINFIEKQVNTEINNNTLTEDKFNKILDLALITM